MNIKVSYTLSGRHKILMIESKNVTLEGDDIPHGLIFSGLMLAMLTGSLLSDYFKESFGNQTEIIIFRDI